MPAVELNRTKIIRRLLELLELDPEYGDCQLDYGAPHITPWAETSRMIVVSRVLGELDHPLLDRPTVEDRPNVEIWVQGFHEDGLESAQISDSTVSMLLRVVARNRQLALDDDRLEGVQTSRFTEADGPMFLRTDQGVITSYRLILALINRIRTED